MQPADSTGYGLAHIKAGHEQEIKNAGFDSVESFLFDALKNIDSIWKPQSSKQVMAIDAGKKGKVVFVQLEPAQDESGDFYRVNSAFPTNDNYLSRKEKKEGWKSLWSKAPVFANASGTLGFADQTFKASDANPMVSPQSVNGHLLQEAGTVNQSNITDFGEKLEGTRNG